MPNSRMPPFPDRFKTSHRFRRGRMSCDESFLKNRVRIHSLFSVLRERGGDGFNEWLCHDDCRMLG